MQSFVKHGPRALLLVAIFVCIPSVRTHADWTILESNSPKYRVGTTVPDDTTFDDLGENCVVRALKGGQWGETVTFGRKSPQRERGGGRGINRQPPC
jgi:hypothetical protein